VLKMLISYNLAECCTPLEQIACQARSQAQRAAKPAESMPIPAHPGSPHAERRRALPYRLVLSAHAYDIFVRLWSMINPRRAPRSSPHLAITAHYTPPQGLFQRPLRAFSPARSHRVRLWRNVRTLLARNL